MDGIILFPKTADEFEAIKKFSEVNAIPSGYVNETDLLTIERLQLAKAANEWFPKSEVTMEEIDAIVNETRAELYAKKNLFNS